MTHEMIVVMIEGEEETYSCEYTRDEVIPPYFLIEAHQYDNIDWEDKYALPPAENTDFELEIELIDHRKGRREDGNHSDHLQVTKVGNLGKNISESLRKNESKKCHQSEQKDREDTERKYRRIERHLHRTYCMKWGRGNTLLE